MLQLFFNKKMILIVCSLLKNIASKFCTYLRSLYLKLSFEMNLGKISTKTGKIILEKNIKVPLIQGCVRRKISETFETQFFLNVNIFVECIQKNAETDIVCSKFSRIFIQASMRNKQYQKLGCIKNII